MPVYRDLDRLSFAIRSDVLSLIRKDSVNLINQVTAEIDGIIESTDSVGDMQISKTEKGASIKIDVKVPVDNATEFVVGVDNAVKGTFRFGKWSDMKVS